MWGYLIISHILIIYLIWLVVRNQKMIKQLQEWVSDLQGDLSIYQKELSLTSKARFLTTRIFTLQLSIADKLKTVKDDKDASEIYELEKKWIERKRRLCEVNKELRAIGASKFKNKSKG